MARQKKIERSHRRSVFATALLIIGAFALNSGQASAVQIPSYTRSSFDGSGSSSGAFSAQVSSVAVDEASGDVYVVSNRPNNPLDKFDAAGNPIPFTDPELAGSTSLPASKTIFSTANVAVDNSGTATQGRIYVVVSETGSPGYIAAFEPSGKPVGGNFPLEIKATDVGVDPSTGDIWVVKNGVFVGDTARRYTSAGVFTGESIDTSTLSPDSEGYGLSNRATIDSNGNIYLGVKAETEKPFKIIKYNAALEPQFILPRYADLEVDPTTNRVYSITSDEKKVVVYSPTGSELAQLESATYFAFKGVAVNGATGKVYVASSANGGEVSVFTPGAPHAVPDLTLGPGSNFGPTSVVLDGEVDPDGVSTSDCHFDWGVDNGIEIEYIETTPCAEGNVLSGSGQQPVSADITGVVKGETYNYRLSVTNPAGTFTTRNGTFVPAAAPTVDQEFVSNVHSDSIRFHAKINPGGAETSYRFEYGADDCASSSCASTPSADAGSDMKARDKSLLFTGLLPGTTYHYRVVASNHSGSVVGPDRTFTTFPFFAVLDDHCPNSHVRQQTGAALLLDCRAYELASAANAGGYDVESDLVASQKPYEGYPRVGDPSKILYAVNNGAIPGVGNPANRGRDPYIATRGKTGWSTEYVGIPSDNPFAAGPFASSLLEADPGLRAFAFGGADTCAPCFADGSTNIPLRLPDGGLVQGIAGSQNPGPAEPAGHIGKHFSVDGDHFVFGTTTQVEPAGNDNGDVTVYERDLSKGGTQVVSTLPDGTTMTGPGIGELDVSADGSRVLVAQRVSTDGAGNDYWHPYMHIGSSPESIDLTPGPGAVSGVLYGGMTADGSKVFFATVDRLTGEDTDNSADIYEADISPVGDLTLTLVSIGTSAGNTDVCAPVQNWNTVSGGPNCNAIAFAGGAGVASGDGTFYFLSPEKLDGPGNGVDGLPNLYVVRPGSPPHFVSTIDSDVGKPPPPLGTHPLIGTNFTGSELEEPSKMVVDQSNGDVYVIENGFSRVARFTSAGAPHPFTEGPNAGTNKITGLSLFSEEESGIAVDNSPTSPFSGDFYVTNGSSDIKVFSPTGEPLGAITGVGTPFGQFLGYPCGVAVDSSNGAVYVADHAGRIWRYMPTGAGSLPISDADYTVSGLIAANNTPCQLGADTAGHVYALKAGEFGQTALKQYNAGLFSSNESPRIVGKSIGKAPHSFTIDPVTNDVYVGEFSDPADYFGTEGKIVVFNENGERFNDAGEELPILGEGEIGPRGLAVNANTGHLYRSSWPHISEFGYVPGSRPLIDNPAVVHAVNQAAVHSYGDFQVTPDGRFAAFASGQSLTGYDNNGHSEVFRYDAVAPQLVCASCHPTGARAEGDAALAPNGLSLADDGRVFFNTTDPIAPRDLGAKKDAYEYENGELQLISTGTSPFDSSLLGISSDGRDAYFFTRDTLVPQDQNGSLVKIYDARAGGGFAYTPPPVPCKASDECHGPGSETPGPPSIRTIGGAEGNDASSGPKKPVCKRPRVLRHGRCIKPHHKNGRRGRHTNHRHG